MQGVETKISLTGTASSVEQLKKEIAELNREVLYLKFRLQSRQRTCGEILKRLFTLLSVIFFVLFLLYNGIYALMMHYSPTRHCHKTLTVVLRRHFVLRIVFSGKNN